MPLWRTVAVVGVPGSGKTSLAIGTLYAEGMQRFLEGLSTYSLVRRFLVTRVCVTLGPLVLENQPREEQFTNPRPARKGLSRRLAARCAHTYANGCAGPRHRTGLPSPISSCSSLGAARAAHGSPGGAPVRAP